MEQNLRDGQLGGVVRPPPPLATGLDPYLALLDNRNVPRNPEIGSPCQRLYGRRTKTLLPVTEESLKPRVLDSEGVKTQLEKLRKKQKQYYDRGAKDLPPLREGEFVRLQTDDGWVPSQVVAVGPEPRSYKVVTEQNREYRRNRKFLLRTGEQKMSVGGPNKSGGLGMQRKPATLQNHVAPHRQKEVGRQAGSNRTVCRKVPAADRNRRGDHAKVDSTKTGAKCRVEGTANMVAPQTARRSGRTIKQPLRFQDFVTT